MKFIRHSLLFSLLFVSGAVAFLSSPLSAETNQGGNVILTRSDSMTLGSGTHEVAADRRLKIILNNNGSIGESWHFDGFNLGDGFGPSSLTLISPVSGEREPMDPNEPSYLGDPEPYSWTFLPYAVSSNTLHFDKIDRQGLKVESIEFSVITIPGHASLNSSSRPPKL